MNITQETKEKDNRITAWPDLGRVVMSCGVAEDSHGDGGLSLMPFVQRHAATDWGDLDEEDKAANDEAIITGARILSAYHWRGEKIWIITEAVGDDGRRAATTILYPHEY